MSKSTDRITRLLEWLMVQFTMDCPLYSAMATSFPTVAREFDEDTYAATNGAIIAINGKEPISLEINRKNIDGLVGHEVNHIILHHTRPVVEVADQEAYRYAQELEAEMWVPESFGAIDDNLRNTALSYKAKGLDTVEKIYLHWMENPHTKPKNTKILDILVGMHGEAKVKCMSAEPQHIDMIVSKVMQAANLAQGMGSVPEGLLQKINSLRQPRVNWRSFFRQFWGTKVGIWDLKVGAVSPRYMAMYHMPLPPLADTHGSPDVVVAIDTSDSMSGDPIKIVISELRGLAGVTSDVDIYICDAAVHGVVTLKEVSDQEILELRDKLAGHGGTDFGPVFEMVKERKSQPQLLVYLTDMFGSFPEEKPSYPVIWMTTTLNPPTPPFGQVVVIPPEEYM